MADLPDNVDPAGTYLISGEFINAILNEIRQNKLVADEGSGLSIDEVGPDGTKASAKGGAVSVSDGTTTIDDVTKIVFVPGADPVGGAIVVTDLGGGIASVAIPILSASPDTGVQVVGVVDGVATYLNTCAASCP